MRNYYSHINTETSIREVVKESQAKGALKFQLFSFIYSWF